MTNPLLHSVSNRQRLNFGKPHRASTTTDPTPSPTRTNQNPALRPPRLHLKPPTLRLTHLPQHPNASPHSRQRVHGSLSFSCSRTLPRRHCLTTCPMAPGQPLWSDSTASCFLSAKRARCYRFASCSSHAHRPPPDAPSPVVGPCRFRSDSALSPPRQDRTIQIWRPTRRLPGRSSPPPRRSVGPT